MKVKFYRQLALSHSSPPLEDMFPLLLLLLPSLLGRWVFDTSVRWFCWLNLMYLSSAAEPKHRRIKQVPKRECEVRWGKSQCNLTGEAALLASDMWVAAGVSLPSKTCPSCHWHEIMTTFLHGAFFLSLCLELCNDCLAEGCL